MAMFKSNIFGRPEEEITEQQAPAEAAAPAEPQTPVYDTPVPPASSKLQHDLIIHGNIESISDMMLYGTVKGNVTCQGCVQAKDAVIEGNVTAKLLNMHGGSITGDLNIENTVMIDGIVNGNVSCEEVLLQCNARVNGDIRCAQFCAAFGALIQGRVSVSGVPKDAQLDEAAAQLAEYSSAETAESVE